MIFKFFILICLSLECREQKKRKKEVLIIAAINSNDFKQTKNIEFIFFFIKNSCLSTIRFRMLNKPLKCNI